MADDFQDGEGPDGIAGYLWRRGERRLADAGMDALYGIGAGVAGTALAPATGGFSYVPGYTVAAMNLGRAVGGVGEAANYGAASRQFEAMPEGPSDSRFQPPMKLGGPEQEPEDFDTAFGNLQKMLIDLDGDGVPEEVYSAIPPQMAAPVIEKGENAMAKYRGQPAPAPNANAMAAARGQPQGFEALRQEINGQMTPAQPSPAQSQDQTWEEWANDPSFNEGRGRYGLVPSVVRGLSSASNAMRPEFNPDGPLSGVNRYIERSVEALGRAPRQISEMSPMEMGQNAMAAAATIPPLGGPSRAGAAFTTARETPDVFRGATTGNWAPVHEASRAREAAIMRAPPHTLQGRGQPGNKGQFRKFDKETREIRDKAIRDRARAKQNPDYRQQYDQSGEPLGSKAARDYLSKI